MDDNEKFPSHSNEDSSKQINEDEVINSEQYDYQEEASASPELKSNDENKEHKKSPKSRNGLSGMIGGLIGGVAAAIIVAMLFVNNIIPINNEETSAVNEPANNKPNFVETLATDDDTEVSTNIEEVSEAVVGVVNLQQRSVWTGNEEAGTGSGIIYKKEDGKAYVVTNQHVVDGAENVEVVLGDDQRIPAKVLGKDPLTDLAVLEIAGENINTVAKLGTSSDITVGETVLAIGNPLGLEFANSVTRGIVSGLNRSIEVDTNGDGQPDWVTEVLQTDAAINPGNSGGALINADGEVIGINSMKIAQSAVEGIGFAIPVDAALPIMEQLETEGEIARPLIGISTAALYQVPPEYRNQINLPDDIEGGMVVANVEAGSPADDAGLQQFDVLTTINGEEVTSILELRKYLYSQTAVGETVNVEYIRDGKVETTELALVPIEDAA